MQWGSEVSSKIFQDKMMFYDYYVSIDKLSINQFESYLRILCDQLINNISILEILLTTILRWYVYKAKSFSTDMYFFMSTQYR